MSGEKMRRRGDGEEDNDNGEEKAVDLLKIKDWKGKTIRSAVMIRAEIGRTYSSYLCVVFNDESHGMLGLASNNDVLYEPCPSIDEMQKAPDFFSPEEIAARALVIEKRKRARHAEQKRSKLQQIERLYQELDRMEK